MYRPSGADVAARAIAAVTEGHSYAEMDCQAFVEHCVTACGGAMAYAGSNDMARNAVSGLWTLAQAKAAGKLIPGAALFIHDTDGGEPQKYRADGLGNFSHVGYYVGENALTDQDANGNSRVCNCVHSSATMARVAGSTLKNGWTHAGWFAAIEYADTETDADDALAGNAAEDTEGDSLAQTVQKPTAETAVVRYYTVKRGCLGGAVRRLQTWLTQLGYAPGGVDGEFGANTEAAVRAFQAAQALSVDGVVGQKTWAKLYAAYRAALEEGDAE